MQINKKLEPNIKSWFWRLVLGPAIILEGIVATITVGTVSLGLSLKVARNLGRVRFDANSFNTQLAQR